MLARAAMTDCEQMSLLICCETVLTRQSPSFPIPTPMLQAQTTHHRRTFVAALLCVTFAVTDASAQGDTPFVNDAEMEAPRSVRDGRKWQEEAVRFPAWPRDADLVEIKVDGPASDLRHSIDISNLTTGEDDVVRYTVVTESSSGARNVSFEGLRCTPKGRYKAYAYGSGSRFSPTGNSEQWNLIDERSRDRFRFALWRHYLCVPRLFKPRDHKDQIRMLKSGRVPTIDNAGFLTN